MSKHLPWPDGDKTLRRLIGAELYKMLQTNFREPLPAVR